MTGDRFKQEMSKETHGQKLLYHSRSDVRSGGEVQERQNVQKESVSRVWTGRGNRALNWLSITGHSRDTHTGGHLPFKAGL